MLRWRHHHGEMRLPVMEQAVWLSSPRRGPGVAKVVNKGLFSGAKPSTLAEFPYRATALLLRALGAGPLSAQPHPGRWLGGFFFCNKGTCILV
jgi:hypothetical protein